MKYERTARLKLKDKPLFELLEFREKERRVFPELLKALKFANKYGNVVYYLTHKMLKAGMIEKTEEGYVLSLKFAEKLRKWAE